MKFSRLDMKSVRFLAIFKENFALAVPLCSYQGYVFLVGTIVCLILLILSTNI